MTVQILADPSGRLLRASPALPGALHDARAAREHGVIRTLTDVGTECCADKGHRGTEGTIRIPYRGRRENLSVGQKAANRSHAKIRALVEQAAATLRAWRLLRRLRCSTTRVTGPVRTGLCLHLTSSDRGRKELSVFRAGGTGPSEGSGCLPGNARTASAGLPTSGQHPPFDALLQ